MSLVGSLEDLGLGDILQIISLSGKSGVLLLRSDRGEGRFIFRKGLIRGASFAGGPKDLRELGVVRVPRPDGGFRYGLPEVGATLRDQHILERELSVRERQGNTPAGVLFSTSTDLFQPVGPLLAVVHESMRIVLEAGIDLHFRQTREYTAS